MFFAVGYILASQRGAASTPEFALLPVLAVAALGVALASILLPPVVLRRSLESLKLEVIELPAAERMFNDSPRRARRFKDGSSARVELFRHVQPAFLLGVALAEAVALFGLVLWLQGFHGVHVVGFFVVAWLLILSKFPKPAAFQRQLEAIYDADLVD